MTSNRKLYVLIAIIFFTLLGTVSVALPGKREYKNLKVLPKDIKHDELEAVMSDFQDALGVKCEFCHSSSGGSSPVFDFADDSKAQKIAARRMMRMTLKINKKYFRNYQRENKRIIKSISCNTCHHGKVAVAEKR